MTEERISHERTKTLRFGLPFAYWTPYSDGEGIDQNGWERKWRARLTCESCGRRFWRVFRYACRRCM